MPTEGEPGKTGLYDLHLRYGAKMVPFGGYSMPVQYSDLGVGESHTWTREKCSIFDVGHMVQYHVEGPGAEAFLESITPAGIKDMRPGQNSLSALLHPVTGGIVDDCIITRLEEGPKHLFYLVTNAGCREKDYKFLSEAIEKWDNTMNPVVHLRHLQYDGESYGLIALQGPMAVEILKSALSENCKVNVENWYFGMAKHITLNISTGESLPIVASRGGYTGEDGFEMSIHPSQVVEVTETLLNRAGKDKLRLAGLGARDSLRLEAGMCLYGHDLDDTTTPVEAALGWIIPKSRRTQEGSGFNGAETVIPQLTPASKGGVGVERRRVGLVVEGAPAREGAEVIDEAGQVIGKVTSGCPSPTMKKNIAMAYVKNGMHKAGTELQVMVRRRKRKAVVTKMPFIPSKYWKGGATPG
ncbi:Aminomethyltransferase, mitochondrial [Recurvomyces mirabilis]|uniref:Aminomethyltransferase, mitochondrial n=1 Tax=Recurvomyces mirabilis TaxID=574656 RepID=UPI002DDECEE3|nr:Aminomethyltransferase, mitochondrial [Recurvomyces mirabilis]